MSGYGIYNMHCSQFFGKEFIPQDHQQFVLDYYIDRVKNQPDFRGLLLYHTLGSGKTCSTISVANDLIKKGLVNNVYILTPGSLRPTWIEEYCKKCGKGKYELEKFTFLTYNYDFFKNNTEDKINFSDKTLIVIDEVHNFFNAVKNESKVCSRIYRLLLDCKSKFMLLSGTPVYNSLREFWYIGSILKPKIFGKISETSESVKDKPVYPSAEKFDEMFSELFINDENIDFKEIDILKSHITDCISYHEGKQEFLPTVIYNEPIKCQASQKQLEKYLESEYSEQMLANLNLKDVKDEEKRYLLQRLKIMAYKKILSRKVSNCYYPTNIAYLKDEINRSDEPIERLLSIKDINQDKFTKIKYFDTIFDYQNIVSEYLKSLKAVKDLQKFESEYDIEKYNELITAIDRISELLRVIKNENEDYIKAEEKKQQKVTQQIAREIISDYKQLDECLEKLSSLGIIVD